MKKIKTAAAFLLAALLVCFAVLSGAARDTIYFTAVKKTVSSARTGTISPRHSTASRPKQTQRFLLMIPSSFLPGAYPKDPLDFLISLEFTFC